MFIEELTAIVLATTTAISPANQTLLAERPTTLPAPRPPAARPPARPPQVRPPIARPDYRPSYGSDYRQSYRYGRGFAGRVRCNSRGDRNSCYVRTQGRVVLVREHGGRCSRGYSWGHDSRRIWVSRGCRATFAYGYGGYYPGRWDDDRNDRRDAALVVGGVAVAAGLVAILSKSGKSMKALETTSGAPATVVADLNWVSSEARPALQKCLQRAARDVGVTGGTRIVLQNVSATNIEAGAYEITGRLTGEYPDANRDLQISCEATANEVEQFEFGS